MGTAMFNSLPLQAHRSLPISPDRKRKQEHLQRDARRLTPVKYGLYNVGRQQGKAQHSADIRGVESSQPQQFRDSRECAHLSSGMLALAS
jgi:hypothetical protein